MAETHDEGKRGSHIELPDNPAAMVERVREAIRDLKSTEEMRTFFAALIQWHDAHGARFSDIESRRFLQTALDEVNDQETEFNWAVAIGAHQVLYDYQRVLWFFSKKLSSVEAVKKFLEKYREGLRQIHYDSPEQALRIAVKALIKKITDSDVQKRWQEAVKFLQPSGIYPSGALARKRAPAIEVNPKLRVEKIISALDEPKTVNGYFVAVEELNNQAEIRLFIIKAAERWSRLYGSATKDAHEIVASNIKAALRGKEPSAVKLWAEGFEEVGVIL